MDSCIRSIDCTNKDITMSMAHMMFITGFIVTLAMTITGFYFIDPTYVLYAWIAALAGGHAYSTVGFVLHMKRMQNPEDDGVKTLLFAMRDNVIVFGTKDADPLVIDLIQAANVKLIPDVVDSIDCTPHELAAAILIMASTDKVFDNNGCH